MDTITVTLSDDKLEHFRQLADQFGVSLNDLLCASIEDALGRSDARFEQAVERLLEKNAALYKRLA